MLGLDYSSGRPRGSVVKADGYDFVIRYCGQPSSKKNATRAEVDDMLANDVAVSLVFESTAARAAQGFNAGVTDAEAATAHQAALGIPAERPIYYAVDYDADPNVILDYFRGVNAVAGPDSVYGSCRVVRRLEAEGLVVGSWQTVAWSKGQLYPGAELFQRLGYVYVDGIQCDVNEALAVDFGQYPLASLEEDMPYSEKQIREMIYAAVTDWMIDAHDTYYHGNPNPQAHAIRGVLDMLPVAASVTISQEQIDQLVAAVREAATPVDAAAIVDALFSRLGLTPKV